jgi:hypothetical protein
MGQLEDQGVSIISPKKIALDKYNSLEAQVDRLQGQAFSWASHEFPAGTGC